jgi:4-oxalocrotonate tautomerase
VQVSVWGEITPENKKKTVEGITKVFEDLGVPKEAVHILIYEAPKRDWAFGEVSCVSFRKMQQSICKIQLQQQLHLLRNQSKHKKVLSKRICLNIFLNLTQTSKLIQSTQTVRVQSIANKTGNIKPQIKLLD